jgi:hypothetical protein
MNTFGTLLWIDEKNHRPVNNKNSSVHSYFRQADLLAKTLRLEFGNELVIFTNDEQKIRSWFTDNGSEAPTVIQISSSISVPQGIAFYEAHHKLDALVVAVDLIKSDADRFFLLDCDIVALRRFDGEQLYMIEHADLIVYDISDQVFSTYGAKRVKADIETVAGGTFAEPRWFGGEFIGGSRKGLIQLIEKASDVLPRYFSNISSLHHIGDEMYFTAGINILLNENAKYKVVNQAPYLLISRHWSRHTDRSLRHHLRHCFVHAPGSKPVLEFLSLFKSPPKRLTRLALRFYQLMVLTYHALKRTRNLPQ